MTDTQADLTERARLAIAKAISPQRWAHLNAGEESAVLAEAERLLAAALQSECEAAAAEARRAVPPEAVAWCATLYRITEHRLAKTGDWADEDIAHLRSIIALLDALASPALQDDLEDDVKHGNVEYFRAALAHAAAEARRAAIEECVAAVDVEEELDGDPPQAIIKVMLDDPPEFLRATVRATKRGIRNRIRALSPAPQEETR